jgi:poly(A) polymerase
MAGMTLPDAPWRTRPGMAALLDALDAGAGATRFVGGAVRDTLAGRPVSDVDIATRLLPDDVAARIVGAGLKAVPTGIAHGTVTAVLPDGPVEVTTLRRDVSTDGRRATVAFSDDWREDAARRDFTINALYADPATGAVHDYFGGGDDLAAGRVRFIGDPMARIAEDHLRIMRFFRFHARYGRGAPDADAYNACAARANDLMALSRERIADELLKLLASDDPAPAVALMLDRAILKPVLPEIDGDGLARLRAVVAAERETATPGDRTRRLAALLPPDAARAESVAARLKLSNRQRKRIVAALSGDAVDPRAIAYRFGEEAAIDRLLLARIDAGERAKALADLSGWTRPTPPVGGGALVARGLGAGPDVSKALRLIEDRWIAAGFPAAPDSDAIVDAVVAQVLAERQ